MFATSFKHHIARFALICALFVAPIALFAADDDDDTEPNVKDYLIVKDLPFIAQNIEQGGGLGGYLNGLFKLGMGVAVTLAVVMIVISGIQYMFSDVPGIKIVAKDHMQSVIWGLVLIFGSWLILNTINPNLVEFDFVTSLEKAAGKAGEGIPTGPTPSGGCTDCVPIPTGIPVSASCGQSCKLAPSVVSKLEALKKNLGDANIGWTITEAWPGSYPHGSTCHGTGTCFDANFRPQLDLNGVNCTSGQDGKSPSDKARAVAQKIKMFQEQTQKAGFGTASFEVKDRATAFCLLTLGPLVIPNYAASAPHFHIK